MPITANLPANSVTFISNASKVPPELVEDLGFTASADNVYQARVVIAEFGVTTYVSNETLMANAEVGQNRSDAVTGAVFQIAKISTAATARATQVLIKTV